MMSLSIGAALLELAAAAQSTTSSSFSQSTVIATGTASPTSYWVTPIGLNGGIQIHYQQLFTRYFSEIEQPLSGSIGLGALSGDIGSSRSYPLATGRPVSEVYSQVSAANATFGVLQQTLDTDSLGFLKTSGAGWTSIAAIAGETSWYGPTISQTSADTAVGTSTSGLYGGTYTFVQYTYAGAATGAATTLPAPGMPYIIKTLEANGDIVGASSSTSSTTSGTGTVISTTSSTSSTLTASSTSTTKTSTSTSTTLPPGVLPSTSTSTTVAGAVTSTSTSTTLPPGVLPTTSTSTTVAGAATSTSTSTTLPPGVLPSTSTTTAVAAAATPTSTTTSLLV